MKKKKRGFGSPNYDREAAAAARRAGNAAQKAAGKRFSFADDVRIARRAGKKGALTRKKKRKQP